MAEVVFSFGVFISKLHAARLIVAKARAAGDLKIFALAGGPHFYVVCFAGTEADIAGAEFDNLVVEAEFLESRFGVAGEFF